MIFDTFTNNLAAYFQAQANGVNNADKLQVPAIRQLLAETAKLDPSELATKYEQGIDCGTRAVTKEMLDTMTAFSKRAMILRQASRLSFYGNEVIQQQAIAAKLVSKNKRLAAILEG